MSRQFLIVFTLVFPALSSAAPSHCSANEKVAFSCSVGAKTVSVCVAGGDDGGVQYRYGAPGSPEMSYPASGTGMAGRVLRGSISFASGDAEYVRFIKGDHEYLVYRGEGRGWAQGGLMVLKGGQRLSNKVCQHPVIQSFADLPELGWDDPDFAYSRWEQVPVASD